MASSSKRFRCVLKRIAPRKYRRFWLEEEEDNGAPFPFAIPELVNHLFKFLPWNDLIKCRLVNRLWNETSLGLIPQKQQRGIVLCWGGRFENKHKCGMKDVPKFVAVVNSSAHFPITKFTLEGSAVESDETRILAMDFLKAVAPFATELFMDDYIQERIFSDDTIEFPALKVFKICYAIKRDFGNESDSSEDSESSEGAESFEDDHHWEALGQLDQEIVENAPNLQKLEFDSDGSYYMRYALDLLENANGITSLILPGPFHQEEELTRLAEMGLQLTHLSFCDTYMKKSDKTLMEKVKAFLLTQNKSLESFHLHLDEDLRGLRLEDLVPSLPKLKKFSVEYGYSSGLEAFEDLGLPLVTSLFPALTTLQGQRI